MRQSRKETIDVAGGLFKAVMPVKAYNGLLDRRIERLGIPPGVPLRPAAADLDRGVDTVLQAVQTYLLEAARQ